MELRKRVSPVYEIMAVFQFPLVEASRPHLKYILKFVTGLRTLPPMRNQYKIQLFYLLEDKNLPEASACFSYLYLPVSHTSAADFLASFSQGVLLSNNYFGLT